MNDLMFNELTIDDRNNLLASKPKILSCVLLSDILLKRSLNNIKEIKSCVKRKNTWKRCRKPNVHSNSKVVTKKRSSKVDSYNSISTNKEIAMIDKNLDSDIYANDIGIKDNEITINDQLDEFSMPDMVFDKQFPTFNTAKEYIQDSKTWSFMSTKNIKNTRIIFYRCNLTSDTEGEPCSVKKCLLTNSNSSAFLYRNKHRHNHDSSDQIYESQSCQPDNNRVDTIPTTDMIEIWLASIAQLPENDHTVYCVNYILDRDLKKIRFFLSTRQLLKAARDSRSIHVSSRTQLNWNKLEVILVGTTDLQHKFHHYGLAVCNDKTSSDYEFIFSSIQKGVTECYPDSTFVMDTLLSDCNSAIQNAFKYVYGYATKTVTCLLDFTSKLPKSFANNKCGRIIRDILKIQMSPSADIFNVGIALLFKKWDNEYLERFKYNWIDSNCNWYEGYSYFLPSKNTALLNEYEKFHQIYLTNPEYSFDLFLDQLFLAVRNWSLPYTTGYKYANKPNIPTDIFDDACRWIRQTKNIVKKKINQEMFYYLNVIKTDKDLLNKYCGLEFDTLSDFFDVMFKYHTVRRNQENVLRCDCKTFFKYFVCEHSFGIGYLLNLYEVPLSIIPNPSEMPYYLKLDL